MQHLRCDPDGGGSHDPPSADMSAMAVPTVYVSSSRGGASQDGLRLRSRQSNLPVMDSYNSGLQRSSSAELEDSNGENRVQSARMHNMSAFGVSGHTNTSYIGSSRSGDQGGMVKMRDFGSTSSLDKLHAGQPATLIPARSTNWIDLQTAPAPRAAKPLPFSTNRYLQPAAGTKPHYVSETALAQQARKNSSAASSNLHDRPTLSNAASSSSVKPEAGSNTGTGKSQSGSASKSSSTGTTPNSTAKAETKKSRSKLNDLTPGILKRLDKLRTVRSVSVEQQGDDRQLTYASNPNLSDSLNSTGSGSASAPDDDTPLRCFVHYDVQSVGYSLFELLKSSAPRAAGRSGGQSASPVPSSASSSDRSGRKVSTGASAASARAWRSADATESDSAECEPEPCSAEAGDGRCNMLVESCPAFRNEVGGEPVHVVALTRFTAPLRLPGGPSPVDPALRQAAARIRELLETARSCNALHVAPACHAVTVLDDTPTPALCTPVTHGPRDDDLSPCHFAYVDHGATYYRNFFYGFEHQNWVGMDDQLGPVCVSLRRERFEPRTLFVTPTLNTVSNAASSSATSTSQADSSSRPVNASTSTSASASNSTSAPSTPTPTGSASAFSASESDADAAQRDDTARYLYRMIVRTKNLATLRGYVLEDSIPTLGVRVSAKSGIPAKCVLEYVVPQLSHLTLRLANSDAKTCELLAKVDEQRVSKLVQ